MLLQLLVIFCLLVLSTQVQWLTVAECRELFLLSLAFTVARGCWDGTMRLWKKYRSHSRCCRTKQNPLEVAIHNVGQLLNVEHLAGVTYDVSEGGPDGTFHLHVSLCLIRVDD